MRGSSTSSPTTSSTRDELGLRLKLIGTAERVGDGLSVRVHPAFLYPGHPLASVNGPFNAVTVESEAITEITMSGPGAGGPQTAQRGARRRDQRDDPAGLDARRRAQVLEIVQDVVSAFYLHLEVADEPGVLAQVAQVLAAAGRVGQVGRAEGPAATRRGW